MKEDAPAPKHPPRKRYQIESPQKVPETWLHTWAGDEDLSEDERQRAREELARRKALIPDRPLGLLVDAGGITPQQFDALTEMLGAMSPTEIHHPGVPSRVHQVCRRLGVPVNVHRDVRDPTAGLRTVVLSSQAIIGLPRGREQHGAHTPAWDMISYAKHRKLQVNVVLPDGERS